MSDPGFRTTIFAEHRRLFGHFIDFVRMIEGEGGEDPASLDAVVAFLRQDVLRFAHLEEARLLPEPENLEAVAFEHAFLAIEADRLILDTVELRHWKTGGFRISVDGVHPKDKVLKRIHRIEAILELHTLRCEDLGINV